MTAGLANADRRGAATFVLPVVIVAGAGLAARTTLAAYPLPALLLFLWIVADTMTLALLVRTRCKPSAQAVLGALAGACLTVATAAPPAMRATLAAMPWLMTIMAGVVFGHVLVAGRSARQAWRVPAAGVRERCERAASALLPPMLVRLAVAELSVLHLALVRGVARRTCPPRRVRSPTTGISRRCVLRCWSSRRSRWRSITCCSRIGAGRARW